MEKLISEMERSHSWRALRESEFDEARVEASTHQPAPVEESTKPAPVPEPSSPVTFSELAHLDKLVGNLENRAAWRSLREGEYQAAMSEAAAALPSPVLVPPSPLLGDDPELGRRSPLTLPELERLENRAAWRSLSEKDYAEAGIQKPRTGEPSHVVSPRSRSRLHEQQSGLSLPSSDSPDSSVPTVDAKQNGKEESKEESHTEEKDTEEKANPSGLGKPQNVSDSEEEQTAELFADLSRVTEPARVALPLRAGVPRGHRGAPPAGADGETGGGRGRLPGVLRGARPRGAAGG